MKYGYENTDAATYKLLLEKAKYMRNHPTDAESMLWNYLSGGKLGAHFRRQHPVFGYIPDFICLRERLIIEIDGGYHLEGEQPEKDDERTKLLKEQGYTVVRFMNEDVLIDTEETVEVIKEYLEQLKTNTFTTPVSTQKNETSKAQPISLSGSESVTETSQLPPFGRAGVGVVCPLKIRTGFGFDVHRLVEGRDLWLGGIKIEHDKGLLGHSDADVLIHAICDALLGAANMRDIGYHFPDTSASTLDIDSKILLRKTIDLIAENGYVVGNIDATVCAERPKINPHVPAIKACLAAVIGTDEDNISIKATTTERLGFTGREEGISAYAVVLIECVC